MTVTEFQILGSESFTRWLVVAMSARAQDSVKTLEQSFSIPTASECKKFKQIWLQQFWVSPPPICVLTTQTALTDK